MDETLSGGNQDERQTQLGGYQYVAQRPIGCLSKCGTTQHAGGIVPTQ